LLKEIRENSIIVERKRKLIVSLHSEEDEVG